MGVGVKAETVVDDEGAFEAALAVACSICFDAVLGGAGDRSIAHLQCGHQFHLDCIGSAFNAKGVMQCPNCRKIEKGNWLYANGCRSLPEFNVEAWAHDEDLYDFSYSEVPIGVHWCPFSRLARIAASFEEGESHPAFAFGDLLWHSPIHPDHLASSMAAHACPYLAYLQPLQPSSSSNPGVSSENPIDGPVYHHWSHVPWPTDSQTHPGPPVDLHYHGWEHHSLPHFTPSSRINGSAQPSISSATTRAPRLDSDGLQRTGSLIHPFVLGHGSGSRASGSFVSSLIPPYLSNSRALAHVHEHQQHNNSLSIRGPVFSGVARRSGGIRELAPIGPAQPSPPDQTAFYLFPPTGPSGRSVPDVENTGGTHLYASERDLFAPFPSLHMDVESSWWGPPQSTGLSDASGRMGLWQQHGYGSERLSSNGRSEGSSYQLNHRTWTHHFI